MTNWISTMSRDHVERGVRGRFTQANHGKPHALRRMSRGDWIAFYSPRVSHPDGETLQAFTAIGQVVDDEPYPVDIPPDVERWRRNVDFLDCVETPIRPLIDSLDFVENKQRWGYKFRFGVFRVDDHDFEIIRAAMTGARQLVAAATISDEPGGVPPRTAPPPNDTD
ncbi:EVE domain-containing protein [Mycolicibacterium baixiangningiae]|uniref:EVE domain-containing protein n=1 Tax=Mycolicibacterium baixiangningiae TaxID=2761578 RepID=UPI00186725F6|nr:EVE domain-containing protein [Mycolicibacterium baixiangningiae]